MAAVMRQPPAFPRIAECSNDPEAERVIHKSQMRLPRKLNKLALPVGEPFTEILCGQVMFLQHATRCQIDHAQARLPAQASRLVERSIYKHQTLSEGIRIMRIRVDNSIALNGNGTCRGDG